MSFINVKNNKKYRAEFIVVNNGTPILGAKAAQQMKLLEVKYQNIAAVEETTTMQTENIQSPIPSNTPAVNGRSSLNLQDVLNNMVMSLRNI